MANDACFEYNDELPPHKSLTFKNSNYISACDGTYHKNHVYQSQPFIAAQSGIHFWLYDTNYSDNSGVMHIELIELDGKNP